MAETKRKDQTHQGLSRTEEMSEAEKDRMPEKKQIFRIPEKASGGGQGGAVIVESYAEKQKVK
jgi:hypothetical protein